MSYALDLRRSRIPHSLHGLGCGCSAPMAGLGELVTPSFSIWTPARRQAWLNQVHTQVNAFTGDIRERETAIRGRPDGPRFLTDWAAFKNAWTDFYRTEIASSLIFSGTTERTQEFVNRYNALESRYTVLTGARVTSGFTHAEEEMPETDLAAANRTLMTWTVIGIVGVAGLGYLLSQYAKVKTLSKLAFNRRRRRRWQR